MFLISIGKPSVGKKLIQHLGVNGGEDFIFADPDNTIYDDMDLNKGVAATFFNPATPYAIRDRLISGRMNELIEVLGKWSQAFYIPPKAEQAFNQGGTFIFRGVETLFAHYDEGTGAHPDIDEVLRLAYDSNYRGKI